MMILALRFASKILEGGGEIWETCNLWRQVDLPLVFLHTYGSMAEWVSAVCLQEHLTGWPPFSGT